MCKFYGHVSFIRRSIISCTYANHPVYAELRRYDRRFLLNKGLLCITLNPISANFANGFTLRVARSNFVCTSHTNVHIVAEFDPVTSHCAQIRHKVRRVIEWFQTQTNETNTESLRTGTGTILFFVIFFWHGGIGILRFKELSISRSKYLINLYPYRQLYGKKITLVLLTYMLTQEKNG